MTTKIKTAEDYKREQEKRDAKGKRNLEKALKNFRCPAGYDARWVTDLYGRGECFQVSNATESITFYVHGDGTTSFDTAQGRRTFDRRGVESSFYWMKQYDGDSSEYAPPAAIIERQLERIKESRAKFATAIAIPQIGFTIQPAELENLKKTLESGGSRTFTPAGFGTGYRLSTKWSRSASQATSELQVFLGIRKPVFVERIDCD